MNSAKRKNERMSLKQFKLEQEAVKKAQQAYQEEESKGSKKTFSLLGIFKPKLKEQKSNISLQGIYPRKDEIGHSKRPPTPESDLYEEIHIDMPDNENEMGKRPRIKSAPRIPHYIAGSNNDTLSQENEYSEFAEKIKPVIKKSQRSINSDYEDVVVSDDNKDKVKAKDKFKPIFKKNTASNDDTHSEEENRFYKFSTKIIKPVFKKTQKSVEKSNEISINSDYDDVVISDDKDKKNTNKSMTSNDDTRSEEENRFSEFPKQIKSVIKKTQPVFETDYDDVVVRDDKVEENDQFKKNNDKRSDEENKSIEFAAKTTKPVIEKTQNNIKTAKNDDAVVSDDNKDNDKTDSPKSQAKSLENSSHSESTKEKTGANEKTTDENVSKVQNNHSKFNEMMPLPIEGSDNGANRQRSKSMFHSGASSNRIFQPKHVKTEDKHVSGFAANVINITIKKQFRN